MSKNMVFGAMYDRGAPSLAFGPEMDYLENELGGKRWTLKEVETFFKRFFERYPQLAEWQAEQKRAVYREQVLETELGRLRRFPLITDRDNGAVGRQGINTPIQSLASDITLDALIRIHTRLKKLNRKAGRVVAHIVLTVHDSILTECRSSYAKQVKIIIAEEMATVPIDTVVPFAAKITTGKNRGNLK
jgi:DNA polymerase-1